jgi:hypothetical protein
MVTPQLDLGLYFFNNFDQQQSMFYTAAHVNEINENNNPNPDCTQKCVELKKQLKTEKTNHTKSKNKHKNISEKLQLNSTI